MRRNAVTMMAVKTGAADPAAHVEHESFVLVLLHARGAAALPAGDFQRGTGVDGQPVEVQAVPWGGNAAGQFVGELSGRRRRGLGIGLWRGLSGRRGLTGGQADRSGGSRRAGRRFAPAVVWRATGNCLTTFFACEGFSATVPGADCPWGNRPFTRAAGTHGPSVPRRITSSGNNRPLATIALICWLDNGPSSVPAI